MGSKGLCVNMDKPKVIVSGVGSGVMVKSGE